MTENTQKIREIIQNYSHDFRDMKMSEKELEKMMIDMLYEITQNTEPYPHIFAELKEKGLTL